MSKNFNKFLDTEAVEDEEEEELDAKRQKLDEDGEG